MANGLLGGAAAESATEASQEGIDAPDGQESNVTPEEQAAKDNFVKKAWEKIYDEKTFPTVMESVYGAGDPVTGLASTTATIVTRLFDSARKAGHEIGPDVLLHGGIEILEDLASTAGVAKLHDYTPQELEAATLRALDMAREQMTQSGALDPRALQAEFGQIVQADKAGKLGEMIPGLAEASEGPQPGQEGLDHLSARYNAAMDKDPKDRDDEDEADIAAYESHFGKQGR